MMAHQHILPFLDPSPSETNLPADEASGIQFTSGNTSSSMESAKPIPKGEWTMNISGNCPGCHHHHKSTKIYFKATSDSTHIGDVHCENCQRLWLDFGRRNSTRISLLSQLSVEANPLENTFHSTIVQMIRPTTAIAALSPTLGNPTLTDIPESSSSGPSRETSLRSTTRNGIQNASSTTNDGLSPAPKALVNNSLDHITSTSVPHLAQENVSITHKRRTTKLRLIFRFREKIGAKFPILQKGPLGRLFPHKIEMSPKRQGKQPIREPLPSRVPAPAIIANASDGRVETQSHVAVEPKQHELNVCASSTSPEEALESLRAIDKKAIEQMPPHQRFIWGREQFTAFKSLTKVAPSRVTSACVDIGTQVDISDALSRFQVDPSRRHSELAYVGNRFDNLRYWDTFRGSNSSLNGRPLSVSETVLSDADTAVEGMSATSTSRHILHDEVLQRDRSPRPPSFQSAIHTWQQVYQIRAEGRRSFDSAATGGNVRSITTARGRALNRLSRTSAWGSTIHARESSLSQVQLAQPTNEETE